MQAGQVINDAFIDIGMGRVSSGGCAAHPGSGGNVKWPMKEICDFCLHRGRQRHLFGLRAEYSMDI